MKEYFKWAIIGSAFLIPFLSFVVTNDMFFPYIVGKNFGFRVLVEIMFVSWIALAYLDGKYRPKISHITIAVTLLVVVIGIADVFGVNFDKSFWSNYERMDGYITTIHLFVYFLVLSSVFNSEKMWERLFNIMILASVILGLMGLGAVFGENSTVVRLSTTLGNSIYLAVYMLFHVFITTYCLFKDRISEWGLKHYLYIGAIIVQFLNLYFTATRGTMLGLVGGVILTSIIIAIFERDNKTRRKVAIVILGVIVFFVSIFVFVKDTEFVQGSKVLKRFADISIESGTGGTRFVIWDMAYQGFKEKPVLGWGQGNFPYVFNKYYNPEMYHAEPWYDRAHNVFFDWLIAGGVVGLLSYLSIFLATLYVLWRKNEDSFTFLSKAVITGFLAAYFFHNIFVFDNLVSYILFFTLIAFIHSMSVYQNKNTFGKIRNFVSGLWGVKEGKGDLTLLSLVVVVTVGVVYFLNYGAYAQNKALLGALRLPANQAQESLEMYKKALSYDSFGNGETRERLLFGVRKINNKNVSKEVRDEYFTLAIDEINKQIKEMPGESKYPLFASSLYSMLQDYQSAVDVLKVGLEIAPKKDLLLMAIGDAYTNLGQHEDAMSAYAEAFNNSEKKNKSAALRYAHSAIRLNDEQLASDIMTPFYGTHRIPDPLILNIYGSRGQFDVIRDIYIDFIDREPDKPEYRFKLAGVYLQLKEKDKAIETLQQAIDELPQESYPTVHSDANMYMEQIQNGEI